MPCSATLQDGKAYVWDPEGVLWLRDKCRLVGALTGNAAEHKSAVTGGLPCELSPEELALALKRGWVTLQHDHVNHQLVNDIANSTDSVVLPPAWLPAVSAKAAVTIPTSDPGLSHTCTGEPVLAKVRLQSAVFEDLHDHGYYITDGAKFGADYLLYPGDPMLFHAQFTVQPIKCEQNIAAPLLLGSARGSHAARKHLLLATEDNNKLTYITIAPEGSTDQVISSSHCAHLHKGVTHLGH